MPDVIVAIDQGTTGTTCIVLGADMEPVGRGYAEIDCQYPRSGWVEQRPEDLWTSTLQALQEASRQAQITPQEIGAIGITNQRETTILWDRNTHEPVAPAIVWQCRRTQSLCESLKEQGLCELYHSRTGLLLDPYFSGTKIRWLLDHYELQPRAARGELAFGTVDSWLLAHLTGHTVHATDPTNASRTLLLNIHTGQWDPELLAPLSIPAAVLPQVLPSCGVFGTTRGIPGLPDGIPISGILGDQQAALFGQRAFQPGEAKCTYGTGAFLMLNTGDQAPLSDDGLLTTIAWTTPKETVYALEGSAFIAGAAVQWLRDQLQIIDSAPQIEALARTVQDNGGVYFVPALAGLGAPYWRPEARGVLWGLTRGTTRGHIARAVLESIALQNHVLLELMEKTSETKLSQLRVDGGAAANNLLMQFQADILQKTIVRPQVLETTAMGAATMAALGAGMLSSLHDLKGRREGDQVFIPSMEVEKVTQYTKMYKKMVFKA